MAVVQAVLLFEYDMWVLTPGWRNSLMVSTTGRCGGCLAWYLNINRMRYACLHPLGRRWKLWGWRRLGKTQFQRGISTRPIMDLCQTKEQNPGLCLSRRWWEQPALDILGISVGYASADRGEDMGMK